MKRLLTTLLLSTLTSLAYAQDTAPTAPASDPPPETTPAAPDPAPSGVRFSVGGALEAALGSNFSGKLLPTFGAFTLKLSGEVGDPDAPTATFLVNARTSLNASGSTSLELREALLRYGTANLDLTAGNQLIAWGATDLLSPLNTINPRDLTRPLDPVPLPVFGVQMLYAAREDVTLEAVVVPGFQPNRLPTGLTPTLNPPAGVSIVGVEAAQVNRPALELKNIQGGLRLGTKLNVLDGADLHLSYWNGWRTAPTVSASFTPVAAGQVRVQPVLNYDRVQVFGTDFTVAKGSLVGRLEAAYTLTADPGGTDATIGNPTFEISAQGDYSFIPNLNTTLLLNGKWTHADAGKTDQYSVQTALIASCDLNNRTRLEGGWVQSLTDGSGLLRSKANYTLADGLNLYGLGGLAYGGTGTTHGQFKDYSFIQIGLRFAF